MKKLWMVLILAAAVVVAPAAQAQTASSAEALLEAAKKRELLSGDLDGAIRQYKEVLAKYPRNRAAAAQALVRMGQCYEKLGDAEARKAYERAVREFGDQKEAVATAQARLAALGGGGFGKLEATQLWQDESEQPYGVSADGRLVVLVDWDTGDLAVRDVVAGTTRKLTNKGSWRQSDEFAEEAVISADGQTVVYAWYTGKGNVKEVRSINSDGTGMRVHVSRNFGADALYPAAISPDKKTVILTTQDSGNYQALSLVDNSLKPFGDGLSKLNGISFSPDSKQVVFARRTGPATGGNDLFLANADGSGIRPLLTEEGNDNRPFWSGDGKQIVFFSDRTGSRSVWAIPATGGAPRLLKEGSGSAWPLGLTRDGSLYYSVAVSEHDVQVAELDLGTMSIKGEPKRLIDTFLGRNSRPSFSPDGQWIAWVSSRGQGNAVAVVVRPAAGGEEKVLPVTQAGGIAQSLRWFPDSKALLLNRSEGGQGIYERVEIADGRRTEICRRRTGSYGRTSVTPDGKSLVWLRCGAPTEKSCDLVRYIIETKSETAQALGEIDGFLTTEPAFSPDGKWLAIIAHPRPGPMNFDLFVMPSAGGTLVESARSVEGAFLRPTYGFAWAPDSKHILYRVATDSRDSQVEFRMTTVEGGTPKTLPLIGRAPTFNPDGRLAYVASRSWTEVWVIRNLSGM